MQGCSAPAHCRAVLSTSLFRKVRADADVTNLLDLLQACLTISHHGVISPAAQYKMTRRIGFLGQGDHRLCGAYRVPGLIAARLSGRLQTLGGSVLVVVDTRWRLA